MQTELQASKAIGEHKMIILLNHSKPLQKTTELLVLLHEIDSIHKAYAKIYQIGSHLRS